MCGGVILGHKLELSVEQKSLRTSWVVYPIISLASSQLDHPQSFRCWLRGWPRRDVEPEVPIPGRSHIKNNLGYFPDVHGWFPILAEMARVM